MLVDSHCHLDRLDLNPYDGDLSKAIVHAGSLDISHMLCVSIDMDNFPSVLSIAEKYSNVYASVGVHPVEPSGFEPSVEDLVKLSNHKKIIAIGETGLDYFHWDGEKKSKKIQQDRFERHIQASKIANKALIIHTRDAREDTLSILKNHRAEKGVLHCFTETWEMAKSAIDMGFYISFSVILTFKNAKQLQDVARKCPLDRILVETDAPYLTPTPYRGKPNTPGYTRYVAEYLAELKHISFEEVAHITTENFQNCFNIKI